MTSLGPISVISVPVSDQERAKTFYAEVLGFDVLADMPFGPDRRWVQLAPQGAQTSITLVNWFDELVPDTLRGNVIEVADLAEAKAELGARGLSFAGADMETPWGRCAAFHDPDGN